MYYDRMLHHIHGITQISFITRETRTNSQQSSHLLIRPASKQKCRKTQITQSVFNRLPHRVQPHKNPSNLPKLLIKSSEDKVHPPFFLYKEFNDMSVHYWCISVPKSIVY
ncbi:hypothetical protein LDENG_00299180 [Lucifuga dentata]|nr:hypothetical protein LDENG_00299180 [Lucifuga dentata]